MAEIYRRVRGQKIERIIAQHAVVQRRIDAAALNFGTRAEALLALHKHANHSSAGEGHSRITVDKGDIDAYVVLDDTRGLRAALSIEYGRGPVEREDATTGKRYTIPGHEGLFILHNAFGLRAKR